MFSESCLTVSGADPNQACIFPFQFGGKTFHGWQKQKNANSVQEVMEESLSVITKKKILNSIYRNYYVCILILRAY